jgi:hypothetical protein
VRVPPSRGFVERDRRGVPLVDDAEDQPAAGQHADVIQQSTGDLQAPGRRRHEQPGDLPAVLYSDVPVDDIG